MSCVRALAVAAARATACAPALAAAASCAPEFTPASLIVDERLIAVIADPPEAVPGQSVAFTPVVVSPAGDLVEGDDYRADWWRCPDEDSDALGDFWECTVPSQRRVIGAGSPYVDVVPVDLFGPPPAPGETVTQPPEKGLGALLGYWRVVGVTMSAGDRVVDGFKRVPVYLPVPLSSIDPRLETLDVRVAPSGGVAEANTNPLITAVTVHEGSVDGPTVDEIEKGGTYFFVPRYDPRALEAYQSLKADLSGLPLDDPEAFAALDVEDLLPRFEKVQRCEVPIFNWFVTAGRLRREITLDESVITDVFDPRGVACPSVEGDLRTPDTEYTAPTGDADDPLPADGVVHAWVVLRDGRGGTAVRGFSLPLAD